MNARCMWLMAAVLLGCKEQESSPDAELPIADAGPDASDASAMVEPDGGCGCEYGEQLTSDAPCRDVCSTYTRCGEEVTCQVSGGGSVSFTSEGLFSGSVTAGLPDDSTGVVCYLHGPEGNAALSFGVHEYCDGDEWCARVSGFGFNLPRFVGAGTYAPSYVYASKGNARVSTDHGGECIVEAFDAMSGTLSCTGLTLQDTADTLHNVDAAVQDTADAAVDPYAYRLTGTWSCRGVIVSRGEVVRP